MAMDSNQQRLEQYLDYGKSLLRFKWPIAVAALALFAVVLIVIARLPNIYEATTTILVDPQQVPERFVTAAVASDPGARLNTITQQVLSRTRLQEIIDKFNLYHEMKNVVSEEEMIENMRKHITIQVRQGSGPQLSTFTITFQGDEPVTTAKVVDELAGTFIRWNVASREQQVSGTKDFLQEELESAKKNLEEQENRLRQFKMAHLGEAPDQTMTNVQALSGLTTALQANRDSISRLDQEKMLLVRLPQAATTQQNVPDASLTKRGRLETTKRQLETRLNELRENYSESYPDVISAKRRLDEVNAELAALGKPAVTHDDQGEVSPTAVRVELIDKELDRLRAEQRKMQSQMATYQSRIDAAPLREQQLVELTRNYDVSKQHYQQLLDKSFNIGMAASLEEKQKGERFTVLDAAQIPEKPVKPSRKLLIPFALMVSLGLPIIVVLGKEALDSAIKSEADLKALLPANVKVIGSISLIPNPGDARKLKRINMVSATVCVVLLAAVVQILWHMRVFL